MEESVTEHYGRLLKLQKPWRVRAVDEDLKGERVSICVEWPEKLKVACPECGDKCSIYDRLPERTWRHLNVMQYRLELRCAVPRCKCAEHGVKTIEVPWAEPGSRFTMQFEAFAVEVILASRSLSQATDLLHLHWESVQRVIDRAVERGLARRSIEGLKRVGLDEKSFQRGQRYISLMTDLQQRRVLEVIPGRDLAQAILLWEKLPELERTKVEAAAMDMGANFVAATRQAAPQAAIVHDRFHIAKHLNEAVDQTRRQEARKLDEKDDPTLKHTRFLRLHGTMPEKHRASFQELLEMNLKTARAWCLKEQMQEFWTQTDAAVSVVT